MQKHRNRVRLLTARDKPLDISRKQAEDMIRRGEAVILSLSPLRIREARFLTYRAAARSQRGRVIPGVEHPNPSRLLKGDVNRNTGKLPPSAFDHPTSEGSSQGRCFPPEGIPEIELEFQSYKRELLRKRSEESRARQMAREQVARIHNEKQAAKAMRRLARGR